MRLLEPVATTAPGFGDLDYRVHPFRPLLYSTPTAPVVPATAIPRSPISLSPLRRLFRGAISLSLHPSLRTDLVACFLCTGPRPSSAVFRARVTKKKKVLEFRFPGHPAPPLGLLFKMCTSIESWLLADPKNVAAVHCLTGRGRTSTVLACYLAWVGKPFVRRTRGRCRRGLGEGGEGRGEGGYSMFFCPSNFCFGGNKQAPWPVLHQDASRFLLQTCLRFLLNSTAFLSVILCRRGTHAWIGRLSPADQIHQNALRARGFVRC